MGRFFRAPVVQPIDYGPELPFDHIQKGLEKKQAEQDHWTEMYSTLRSKDTDVLDEEITMKDSMIADRQQRLDSIMYDEKGNVRDLTSNYKDLIGEARRQAQEETTGGAWWAMTESKKKFQEYVEEIEARTDVGAKRKQDLINEAKYKYAQRGGIGEGQLEGGRYSHEQLFKGVKAATEHDGTDVAMAYAKGWKSDKIQLAKDPAMDGMVRGTVDQETLLKYQKKYPHLVSIGNGYLQGGSLEIVYFDEVFENTLNALTTNDGLVEDEMQKAYLENYRNPQYQALSDEEKSQLLQQTAMERLKGYALTAAEKEAHQHFSHDIRKNWELEQRRRQAHEVAVEKLRKAEDHSIFTFSAGNQEYTTTAKDMVESVNSATTVVKDKKDALKNYLLPNGQVDPAKIGDPAAKQHYENLLTELADAERKLELNTKMLVKFTGENKDEISKSLADLTILKYDGSRDTAKATLKEALGNNYSQADPLIKEAEKLQNELESNIRRMTPEQQALYFATGALPTHLEKQFEETAIKKSEILVDIAKQFPGGKIFHNTKERKALEAIFTPEELHSGNPVKFNPSIIGILGSDDITPVTKEEARKRAKESYRTRLEQTQKSQKSNFDKNFASKSYTHVSEQIGTKSIGRHENIYKKTEQSLINQIDQGNITMKLAMNGQEIPDMKEYFRNLSGQDVVGIDAVKSSWDDKEGNVTFVVTATFKDGSKKAINAMVKNGNEIPLYREAAQKVLTHVAYSQDFEKARTDVEYATEDLGRAIYMKSYANNTAGTSAAGLVSNEFTMISGSNPTDPQFAIREWDDGGKKSYSIHHVRHENRNGRVVPVPDEQRVLPDIRYLHTNPDEMSLTFDSKAAVFQNLGMHAYASGNIENPLFKLQETDKKVTVDANSSIKTQKKIRR